MQGDIELLKKAIEHTLLKPDAQSSDIKKICQEAREHNFFGVCINSSYVELAKKHLQDSQVRLVSVVGFPLGAADLAAKAFEAQTAIAKGADEIDMVIHLGALKDRDLALVKADISAVVLAAQNHPVKVIIETALLTQEEKLLACELTLQAGAHFVKTCTGFSGGGATVEDILLMKKAVRSQIGVKASGGIKLMEQALALLQAGATRLGTSSGVSLVSGAKAIKGSY